MGRRSKRRFRERPQLAEVVDVSDLVPPVGVFLVELESFSQAEFGQRRDVFGIRGGFGIVPDKIQEVGVFCGLFHSGLAKGGVCNRFGSHALHTNHHLVLPVALEQEVRVVLQELRLGLLDVRFHQDACWSLFDVARCIFVRF